jgi:hypothetical protein
MKKEYIYIGIIIFFVLGFFYLTIKNAILVNDWKEKETVLKSEIENIINNKCIFPTELAKWQNINTNLEICRLANLNCKDGQYLMNNDCGCGCINLE